MKKFNFEGLESIIALCATFLIGLIIWLIYTYI